MALAECFYFLPFCEPIRTRIIFTISTFAFYLLIDCISKKLLATFIILFYIVTLFVFPTMQVYGPITYDYITSVYYTNPAEAFSYLKTLNFKIFIPLIVLLTYDVCAIKFCKKIALPKLAIAALCLVLIAFPAKKFFTYNETPLNEYVYILPANRLTLVCDLLCQVHQEHVFISNELQKPDTWKITSQPEKLPYKNMVVVIGESVRKDFLHAYGFPINNTPFIDSSKNIQFNNYLSAGAITLTSLRRTLTISDNIETFQSNNDIVSLSKKLGLKTYWISNQGKYGGKGHNSPITAIAVKSDSSMFLSLNLKHFETYSDTAMFPLFDNVLNDTADNKFIVLHMWGAHPYVCDRTNGKYDEFIKSKEISCYNKIIKDLDAFLEHVYTALANKHESFCLIYFSDHGLMIKPDFSLTHRSASVKQSFQVPLLIWSSELDTSMQINAIRTGKDFLHLFTELLNVKTANVERQYKFVSEEKNDDKKLEVFTHGAAAYYDSLPDNSNDIIFDK